MVRCVCSGKYEIGSKIPTVSGGLVKSLHNLLSSALIE